MVWWMLLLGAALVVLVTFDVLMTSVSAGSRSGPLTSAATNGTWALLSKVVRRDGSPLLRTAGPVILTVTIVLWVVGLWVGWALIFSADVEAVVSATTSQPVGGSERILFAAYTVYTLGYGNYVPAEGWQVVSGVALVNGFALMTLAVTYVIPVVTAVTDRRRHASVISAVGTTPEQIVEATHDANGFGALDQLLTTITPQLLLTAQRHLGYPVIHQYRAQQRASAFPPSVAALDDALTLLEAGVADGPRPNASLVGTWRRAVDQMLELVQAPAGGDPGVPPAPRLDALAELGIDHVDRATFDEAMSEHADRRARLHHYLRSARWAWPMRAA